MEANNHTKEHANDTTSLTQRRQTFIEGAPLFRYLYGGRGRRALTYEHRAQNRTSSSPICTEKSKYRIRDVKLKDASGLVVGRGIVEFELQTGDDVGGLILFPHQVAIRVMEVYACGVRESNEDGQVLGECIGQILRWSRSCIEAITTVSQGSRAEIGRADVFDFNEDILPKETIISRNRQDCEDEDELESMETYGSAGHMGNEHTTCSISGVDGLPSSLQKTKYRMSQRVRKQKGARRIGSSRAGKVSLANVETQLQSSICSKGCLKKLDAGAVLMKRFRAWGSHVYEKRASWILETLTDCYNKDNDKFETRLYGVSICNGCYAVTLGYSKRRMEELKSDIRSIGITLELFGVECRGRSSALHGNTVLVPQTFVGLQAMESVFEKYVTEIGCTQPHRQCRRRSDNQMVPLILLPMNTRRKDVFHIVVADVERGLQKAKPQDRVHSTVCGA